MVCWFQNHFLLTRSRESWLWTNKCYVTCFPLLLFLLLLLVLVFVFLWWNFVRFTASKPKTKQTNKPTNQQNVFGLNVFKFLRPSCTITKNQAETEHNRTPFNSHRCILLYKALSYTIRQCFREFFFPQSDFGEFFHIIRVLLRVQYILFVLFLSFISASIQADALILVPNCEWNSEKTATTQLNLYNDVLHCSTDKC